MSLETAHLDLSPPVRRLAAVGLLLIAVLAVVVLVIDPLYQAVTNARELVAQRRDAIARFEALNARLPQLQAQRAALEQNVAGERGFLNGANDALRAAEAQNRIKSIVENHGAQLASTQILPGRDENGFRRIPAQIVLSGPVEAIAAILYDCEYGEPFLFVDTFQIRARPIARLDDPRTTKTLLDVRLEVSAYARAASP
jgi:general secretion pathway protein M